jgi:RNA polymerase sigma-70 factor, ECF subfamily
MSAKQRGASLDDIERVYRDRLDRLRSLAAAIVRDRDEACDVVQDAFAHAVRARESFRGEGTLEGWLWRTVLNTARSRARQRRPQAGLQQLEPRPEAGNGHADPDGTLELAVALLPERQRLTLFLRHYADLEYRTIAEVLGVAPGTVSATLHATHRTLRRHLEKEVRT